MSVLKFTVVTPSFNQGNFIEEAIYSVVSQEYKNVEYFVIDGGSNDQSLEVIKKYEHKITFWVSERDRGQSHALNKALKKATGDILIWINSDDILEPGALEKVSRYFAANPLVDVVHGRSVLFQEDKQLIRGADEKYLPEQYLAGMAFPQPSAFIRMSAVQRVKQELDESLHFGMDYDLFSCLYLNCDFLSVPDIFSKYRLHSGSKTYLTNQGFAHDWQKVFCKVVASINNGEEIMDALKELHLWHEHQGVYPASKSFKKEFVLKAFQYFLYFQINFYYRDLCLSQVRKLGTFIKQKFPEFYTAQRIHRLHLIAYIPLARQIIPLIRKPTF
jgi:glycosyltransferase involved in cell wall biosynthesis